MANVILLEKIIIELAIIHGVAQTTPYINMGPCHCRVLRWAKSYTKKLDGEIKVDHDLDTVGALSIMWSLVWSVMPVEILKEVDLQLGEDGLPHLATQNVAQGFLSFFFFF